MAKLEFDAKEAQEEIERIIVAIKELNSVLKGTKNAKGSFKPTAEAAKKLRQQLSFLRKEKRNLTAQIKRHNKSLSKSTKYLNQNTVATKKNTQAAKKQTSGLISLSKGLKSVIGGFGIIASTQVLGAWLRQTFELIKTFDSLKFALQKLNTEALDFENTTRFIITLTENYGVELVSTTNRYIKFSAAAKNANLSIRETENIFRSVTKASASLGLNTEELTGVYLALEQMLSKGKVTTEELRRQLGERLPGAFGIMAASMGKTLPELDEMLRKGEVLSAEVLPNFADALEVAYGIDKVDKIDTLVAAQNRLATAWQDFVKAITDSEGPINKTLSWLLNKLTTVTKSFRYTFDRENVRIEEGIIKAEELTIKGLRKAAKEKIEILKGSARDEKVIAREKDLLISKLASTGPIEERKIIQEEIEAKRKELIEYNKLLKSEMITEGQRRFGLVIRDYEEAYENYHKIIKDFEEVKNGQKVNSDYSQDQLDKARAQYIVMTGFYNTYRKFMEESDIDINPPKDGKNIVEKRLKEISDLNKEANIERLKSQIKQREELIDSDNTGFKEKIDLIKKNWEEEQVIIELQRQIEIEKAVKHEKEKIAEVDKAIKEGKKITGENPDEYIDDLATQRRNKISIADDEAAQKTIKSREQLNKDIMKIVGDGNDLYIKGVKDKYNLEIIEAKKAYDESAKTEQDKENLAKRLAEINVAAINEEIDARVKLLEFQLRNKNLSKDARAEIILEINELNAAKDQMADTNQRALNDERLFWFDILSIIQENVNAIGELVDTIFNKRIQNIEAEIKAEEDKYDRLIQLAENDVEQKKTLERNKAEAIKKLEKEKLKEEQKQAKARKAFAISDIIFSTATAIMRAKAAAALMGPAGTAWFAIQAALISSLAAINTATVLAEPIPQYKDGLPISNKDHVGMINDGGKQEYIKRGDSILTTKTKNAIVSLKKGDTVYKSYDDMINKQLLINAGISPIGIKEDNFNEMFFGIQSSIKDGFKKAKINNVIKVINNVEQENYRKSRWA